MTSNFKDRREKRLGWLKPIALPALVALVVLVAGGVFLDRQSSFLTEERARAGVILPSGRWEIAAVPKGGWGAVQTSTWMLRMIMVIAGALILVPIIMTGCLIGERQRHFRELKLREATLERLSRRLGLALDTSRVGVWEMDIVTQCLVWDDRMNELYGLPADGGERAYEHWKNGLHPDDYVKAERDFADGIKTGRYRSEFRSLHPDGSVRNIRSIGAVYADAGSNAKIVGVNWDVAAGVLLNEELHRANLLSEARNRDLEAARVRIEHNALHDSLTALPRRRTQAACSGRVRGQRHHRPAAYRSRPLQADQ